MVAVGFEPTKHNALDLESSPFDQAREHYLIYYYTTLFNHIASFKFWIKNIQRFKDLNNKKKATSAGLEPARAKPNRFQVYLLNLSDTMSYYNIHYHIFFKYFSFL